MARTKLEIDPKEFQAVVNQLEEDHDFRNPSELWLAVEKTEWAKQQKPRALTVSVAASRAKELGIVTKAKPGKRGRLPGSGGFPAGVTRAARVPKAEKLAKSSGAQESFDRIRKMTPERFLPLVDRMEKGSRSASVKLMCLQCCGFEVKEVKLCVSKSCPLWIFRPYQKIDMDKLDTPEGDQLDEAEATT